MNILDTIFPRWCIGCGRKLTTGERFLCLRCMAELPRTGFWLQPDDNQMTQMFWGCQGVRIARGAAFVRYHGSGITGRIVKMFKYRGRKDLARYMGQLMAQEIGSACYTQYASSDSANLPAENFFDGIDAIVPVPLTWRRKLERGYNQSQELTAGISRVTGIPVETKLLKRSHFNGSQTTKTVMERIENVHGAFTVNAKQTERYVGKHVLLVDDVITLGATTKSCCEALSIIPALTVSILGFATASDTPYTQDSSPSYLSVTE